MITDQEVVRGMVRRWGWNATAYQILNPGFCYWVDEELDAAVGYVEYHDIRVVGGAPVCPEHALDEVIRRFEADAARNDQGVVYFGAEDRLVVAAAKNADRVIFPIGAQPVWPPDVLLREFAAHASLRAQLNRARNKGVTTRLLTPGHFDVEPLHRCLDEWVETRGLPALHFLIETDTLQNLVDRRLLVAERAGAVVGFTLATPIPARNGWLIEQIVRGAAAPNGTAELLLHDVVEVLHREKAEIVTLGLAPLAAHGHDGVRHAPGWLFHVLHALRAYGTRFYNFAGLEAWKAKFGGSHWDVIYAVTAPGTSLPRSLVALTEAFSAEPLSRFMFRSVWRYVRARAAPRVRGPSGRRRSRAHPSAHA